jgi:spore coat protein U-like protein
MKIVSVLVLGRNSLRVRPLSHLPLVLAFFAVLGFARPAMAAVSCSLSVTNISFGSLSLLADTSGEDTTGTATITCSGGMLLTTYIFCINIYDGSNVSGTQRNMASGSLKLPYALYSDTAYSVPWGSWTGSYLSAGVQTTAVSTLAGTVSKAVTIYAQIPAGQSGASVGSYSDTLAGSANQSLQYAVDGGAGDTACPLTGTGVSTSQFSFSASATVITACNVQNGSLAFASASTLSAPIDGTGSVGVQCSGSAPYSVGLGPGNYASGSQRRMYSSTTGGYINYNLYTDSGYSQPWSTTTASSSCTGGSSTCYLATGNGSYQTVPVYGAIPQQTGPAAGNYADTVTVTVTY